MGAVDEKRKRRIVHDSTYSGEPEAGEGGGAASELDDVLGPAGGITWELTPDERNALD